MYSIRIYNHILIGSFRVLYKYSNILITLLPKQSIGGLCNNNALIYYFLAAPKKKVFFRKKKYIKYTIAPKISLYKYLSK